MRPRWSRHLFSKQESLLCEIQGRESKFNVKAARSNFYQRMDILIRDLRKLHLPILDRIAGASF